MASRPLDEDLKKLPPALQADIAKAAQGLQRHEAQHKPINYDPQTPPPLGEPQPGAPAPKLNEKIVPEQSPKPETAYDRALAAGDKAQAQQQGQELQKRDVYIEQDRER